MTSFFIEYHRTSGEATVTPFSGENARVDALRARLQADFARTDSDIEYVVIEAGSEAELRRTHRRYFEDLDQLAG